MSILIIMPIRMIANTGMMMNAMPMIMIVHRSRDHDHAAGLFPRVGDDLLHLGYCEVPLRVFHLAWLKISDVWSKQVGCGAHIVRTLWHQLAWESDQDQTWMALALCGQRDERTAKEYRVSAARHKAAKKGRQRG